MSIALVRRTAARDRAWRMLAAVGLAALIASCGARSALTPSPNAGAVDMSPSSWDFRFSPGMPKHPVPLGEGWQFVFPNADGVHYLTTAQRPASASTSIMAVIAIATVDQPQFEFRTEPSNTCDVPATVRLFVQRRGDDMSGLGDFEFYRWWSNSVAYELGAGKATLVGDLREPSQWTSVLGRTGADNEPMFRAALADLGNVGFTFGGGCFYGHGVYVAPGTGRAAFAATQYAVR